MVSHGDGDVFQFKQWDYPRTRRRLFRVQVLKMNPFRRTVIAFVKQYIEAHSVQYIGVAMVLVSGKKRIVYLDGMWRIGTNTDGFRAKRTVMEG